MSIRDEAFSAGARVVAGQVVKTATNLIGRFFPKSKKTAKGKTVTSAVTTAVGFVAGAVTSNPIIAGVAQEARVLGLAGTANGVIDSVLGRDKEEDKDKKEQEKAQEEKVEG